MSETFLAKPPAAGRQQDIILNPAEQAWAEQMAAEAGCDLSQFLAALIEAEWERRNPNDEIKA